MNDNEKIVGLVTAKDSPNILDMSNLQQRPMAINMPFMQQLQQTNNIPFPFLFFLFPRISLIFMMMRGEGYGSRRLGVQNITQLIRDENGYIKEIIEIVR